MIKLFRRNKKVVVSAMALTVIGLILVALVIASSWLSTGKIMNWLIHIITAEGEPGPTFLASKASFDRLNEDVKLLLEDTEEPFSYKIIPYTLGIKYKLKGNKIVCDLWPSLCTITVEKTYVLVGFNKDKALNDCTLVNFDPTMIEPAKCNRTGVACLCLCTANEGCEEENCQTYNDVDYFITHKELLNRQGGIINDIKDPITNNNVFCLMLYGEDVNQVQFILGDFIDSIWDSKNLYIEKSESNGKTFIFMANADLDTKKRTSSCFDYSDEFECALGEDRSGNKCVPDFNPDPLLGGFTKCDVCPGNCKDVGGLHYYKKDWLIVLDPCGCAEEVEPKDMCSEYRDDEFECAFGKTNLEGNCVPDYDQGVYNMCVPCSQPCSLGDYKKYWLIAMDPCGCAGQVQTKDSCSDYDNQFDCALGKENSGNKCVPYYNLAVGPNPLWSYVNCNICPECKLGDYVNDWLIALDPCNCTGSYR